MLTRAISIEEVEEAAQQAKLSFRLLVGQRLDLKLAALRDSHHAQVREADAGSAATSRAASVFRREYLVCISRLPFVGAESLNGNVRALDSQNDGRIRELGTGRLSFQRD